jgi:hypothetical protein
LRIVAELTPRFSLWHNVFEPTGSPMAIWTLTRHWSIWASRLDRGLEFIADISEFKRMKLGKY